MVGSRVTDLWLRPRRVGTVVGVNAERLEVSVMWTLGMVTWLKPADVAAGRYQVTVAS